MSSTGRLGLNSFERLIALTPLLNGDKLSRNREYAPFRRRHSSDKLCCFVAAISADKLILSVRHQRIGETEADLVFKCFFVFRACNSRRSCGALVLVQLLRALVSRGHSAARYSAGIMPRRIGRPAAKAQTAYSGTVATARQLEHVGARASVIFYSI